jgi:hypothetical protein
MLWLELKFSKENLSALLAMLQERQPLTSILSEKQVGLNPADRVLRKRVYSETDIFPRKYCSVSSSVKYT